MYIGQKCLYLMTAYPCNILTVNFRNLIGGAPGGRLRHLAKPNIELSGKNKFCYVCIKTLFGDKSPFWRSRDSYSLIFRFILFRLFYLRFFAKTGGDGKGRKSLRTKGLDTDLPSDSHLKSPNFAYFNTTTKTIT